MISLDKLKSKSKNIPSKWDTKQFYVAKILAEEGQFCASNVYCVREKKSLLPVVIKVSLSLFDHFLNVYTYREWRTRKERKIWLKSGHWLASAKRLLNNICKYILYPPSSGDRKYRTSTWLDTLEPSARVSQCIWFSNTSTEGPWMMRSQQVVWTMNALPRFDLIKTLFYYLIFLKTFEINF